MRKLDSIAQERAGSDHFLSLLRRLRLDWLLHHFPPRFVQSLCVFVNGFVTIGLLALLALLSRNPFVFPSLVKLPEGGWRRADVGRWTFRHRPFHVYS